MPCRAPSGPLPDPTSPAIPAPAQSDARRSAPVSRSASPRRFAPAAPLPPLGRVIASPGPAPQAVLLAPGPAGLGDSLGVSHLLPRAAGLRGFVHRSIEIAGDCVCHADVSQSLARQLRVIFFRNLDQCSRFSERCESLL